MKKVFGLVVALFSVLIFTSCNHYGGHGDYLNLNPGEPSPEQYTVYLEQSIFIGPMAMGGSAATGVGIAYLDNGASTVILTADHFCRVPPFMPSGYTAADRSVIFTVTDNNGVVHSAYVLAEDPDVDLCLIAMDGMLDRINSRVADQDIIPPYDPLDNWGHPLGIHRGQNMEGTDDDTISDNDIYFVLRKRGYYGGIYNDWLFIHTIPTIAGQSGSAIIWDGNIVGIVSMAYGGDPQISLAVRGDVIHDFLDQHGIFHVYSH